MNAKQPEHEYLYWEFHENNGRQAVRWKNWKAVRLNIKKDKNAPIELYNLEINPSEDYEESAKHPDIVKKMAEFMKEAHARNADWPLLPGE